MVMKKVGDALDVHPLLLEDIVNTRQRPKAEAYEHHLFVVLKMFYVRAKGTEIIAEQMSFVPGNDYVLSFQEKLEMFLVKFATGFIRKMGPDYLLYALTDAIVDHYFVVLEKIGNALEDEDDELTEKPTPTTLRKIHDLKKEVVFLKKMTWPLRELFGSISRQETRLISKKTNIFFGMYRIIPFKSSTASKVFVK
jgi:magnesium transporter